MQLKPIEDACLGDATTLLAHGFPERSPEFWKSALERLAAYGKAAQVGPIGQLLMVGGNAVGIILTIGSRRGQGPHERKIVNLSSWYVDSKHRWLAPRMLQMVIADRSVVYTDLSPSASTSAINERLGFDVVSQGVVWFCLPWIAMTRRATTRIVPFAQLTGDMISAEDHCILKHHHDLGCLAAAIEVNDRYSPLLFHTTRRKRSSHRAPAVRGKPADRCG